MAKSTFTNANIPVDQPIVERPGVMHREDDAPGNMKHYALPAEHPERTQKGDLGFSGLPPAKHSFEDKADSAPFDKLRKR